MAPQRHGDNLLKVTRNSPHKDSICFLFCALLTSMTLLFIVAQFTSNQPIHKCQQFLQQQQEKANYSNNNNNNNNSLEVNYNNEVYDYYIYIFYIYNYCKSTSLKTP